MKRMGIEAIYRLPNTSKPAPGHKIYPYLLRGLKVERANQVWRGHHLHPDGAWLRLSHGGGRLVQPESFEPSCIDHDGGRFLRRGAGGGFGETRPAGDFQYRPGLQFTSEAFTGVLLGAGVAISMDGKGSWRDNVFVEQLWKSVKYEEVYLKAYDSVGDARASIGRYLEFYNTRRPHSGLDRRTPDEAYFDPSPEAAAA